jgi:hypothetical protein
MAGFAKPTGQGGIFTMFPVLGCGDVAQPAWIKDLVDVPKGEMAEIRTRMPCGENLVKIPKEKG